MTPSFYIGKRLLRANCWVVAGCIKHPQPLPLAFSFTQPAAGDKFMSDAEPFTAALPGSHSPARAAESGRAGILCEAAAERAPARRRGCGLPPSSHLPGKQGLSSQAGQCLSPNGPLAKIKAGCLARSRGRFPGGQEGRRWKDRWTSLSAPVALKKSSHVTQKAQKRGC